jgi:hypothetical protein
MPATKMINVSLSESKEFERLVAFAGEVGRIAIDRQDRELASLVMGLCDQLGIVAREPQSALEAIAQKHHPDGLRQLAELREKA